MRKLILSIAALGLICHLPLAAHSASVTQDWTGTGPNGTMSMDVDDHGGSFANGGNDETYDFFIDGVDVTSTLNFYLFDGSAVDDGADITDDGSAATETGEDFVNGSGLTILEPPSVLAPPITEIAALSDGPLTPFSFHGNQTGLDVQQLTYLQNDKNFVIFEYKIVNGTGAALPVKIGLGGDFDIADDNGDDAVGKDLSVPMVFMNDTIANGNGQFYAPGLAVAGGTLDNYRLGQCCDTTFIASDFAATDINRLHYFNARPNEECDDGNNINGDGCSADCRSETGTESCGNGAIEAGEGCDDGGTAPGDGCDANCLSETCGNLTLEANEECDDGNTTDGDVCSAYCIYEFDTGHFCGDGTANEGGVGDQQTVVEDNEVTISINLGTLNDGDSAVGAFCIVGGLSDVDSATAVGSAVALANDCLNLYQTTIAVCGNGIQNAGEECDDGNTADGDTCASNCSLPGCGNDVVESGEECDDGNIIDGDGCAADCTAEAGACGNGVVDANEECDDGNTNDNDACDNFCTLNAGGQFQGSGCGLVLGTTVGNPGLALWTLLGLAGLALRFRNR